MLEQVTGRAGRGSKKGRAVIQTYNPDAEAVSLVKVHDYRSFYNGEIAKRQFMWYPPFSDIINVMFSGSSEAVVPRCAKYFLKLLDGVRDLDDKVQILGPVPSSVSKIKNKYRWQILIKCTDNDKLNKILKNAYEECIKNKNYTGVSIIIDKNPNMIY